VIAIGIRQGRLSPPAAGGVPEFPWDSWKDEFTQARACGFDTIEWLLAGEGYERNPLWTTEGCEEIASRISDSGVRVGSVCADVFVLHPFFRVPDEARRASVSLLERLLLQGSRIGIEMVIVPVLEESAIRRADEAELLFDSLSEPLELARKKGVRLLLETDLPAPDLRRLIERRRHEALGVCYDTGNAAFQGRDLAAEMRTLAPYLCEIHIKDRKRDGRSVPLGEGDVDFRSVFSVAAALEYEGPLILETPATHWPERAARAGLAFLKESAADAEGAGHPVRKCFDR
jgi:hexulose-6-phosphate isomerase